MEKQMMYLQKICKLKPRMIQYLGGGIVVVVDRPGKSVTGRLMIEYHRSTIKSTKIQGLGMSTGHG